FRAFFSICLLVAALGTYTYGLVVLRSRLGAALAAITYVWAPYTLLDAHTGGDFGESLALALLPGSLLAFHVLLNRPGWAIVGAAALSLAAIQLAHNITALFATGLIGLYAATLAVRVARQGDARRARAGAIQAVGAIVLSLG